MVSTNNKTNLSLNEIFYSIQGEGWHTGAPAIFIRLSGCNLHCTWCDTNHSERMILEPDQIVDRVLEYIIKYSIHRPLIVFTGGEPTIQNLNPTCANIRRAEEQGKCPTCCIAIETNGTNPNALRQNTFLDWVTFSPKEQVDYGQGNLSDSFGIADEIKIVLAKGVNPIMYEKWIHPSKLEAGRLFIQPCSEDYGPAIEFVRNHPKWRLSLQTQKIIDVR